jgi:dinuclear metal center YbgI/SA1388 family protein
MTHEQLYQQLSALYPDSLSAAWDHDGIMVMKNGGQEVQKVLLALDCSNECAKRAIVGGYDLILTHHPLFFKPIGALVPENTLMARGLLLYEKGISVFSFHTRADAVEGGVNDMLADLLGLENTEPFGEGGIGRIGELDEDFMLDDFASGVKLSLGVDSIRISDGYNTVKRVAVVGGDGKDFVKDALLLGADTFVSGRIGYNVMVEAAEMGINLIEAGHFFTEQPVTEFFASIISHFDRDIYVQTVNSNLIKIL